MAEQQTSTSRMAQLKQQELKAWQPVLTPVAIIGLLLVVATIFMPIGIVLLESSSKVIEVKKRYDNNNDCSVSEDDDYTVLPKICEINFTITETMKPPIFFYYELHNFYQNHRRYISSKSDEQLKGEKNPSLSDCSPNDKYNKTTLYTCGLIAGSFFEDRFRMSVNNIDLCNTTTNCVNHGPNNSSAWKEHWADWHDEPNWSMKSISWTSDRNSKYKNHSYNGVTRIGYRQEKSGLQLPDVTNEDFIVWMRAAALPSFRKLHRKIKDFPLNKGDKITVTILNWFPVDDFDGQKWIVLTTTTDWAGGKNYFLARTFLVIACASIILAIIFGILLLFGKRKLADVDAFQWHNRPNTTTVATISS